MYIRGVERRREGSLCVPLAHSLKYSISFQLDSLPRAELVKYIKKQAQLLQKSKARCDGQSLDPLYSLPHHASVSLQI